MAARRASDDSKSFRSGLMGGGYTPSSRWSSERLRQLELQLEDVRHTGQGERAKCMVDLLGRQALVLFSHPPIHEADERPHQEADDGLELERVEPPRRFESRELSLRQLLESLSRLPAGRRAARDRLEEALDGAE